MIGKANGVSPMQIHTTALEVMCMDFPAGVTSELILAYEPGWVAPCVHVMCREQDYESVVDALFHSTGDEVNMDPSYEWSATVEVLP